MVTYEEYAEKTKEYLLHGRNGASLQKAKEYFGGKEAQDLIKSQYKSDVEEFRQGKISERILRIGCPSSVAYCLALLME